MYLLSLSRLHADFVLPNFNCIIEVDGEQHFAPVRFGGVSEEEARKHYEDTVYRDNIKNQIANESKYSIIRIPYYEDIGKDELFNKIRSGV